MLKTEISGRLFEARSVNDGFASLSLVERTFDRCRIVIPLVDPTAPFHKHQPDLHRRPVIRDVELIRCALVSSLGCTLKGAVVEDALIEALKTDGMVQT